MDQLAGYQFFGPLGLYVESFGALHTDIYSLSSATAIYVSPSHRIAYPAMRSPHPLWTFLHLERRTVSVENTGICRTTCEYAGFEGVPEPVIEWSSGVSEEPIQTHPNFVSLAGTPSHPVNGAFFGDKDDLNIESKDDDRGVFVRFTGIGGASAAEFAGITSFLAPCLIKRITTISPSPVNVSAGIGHLHGSMLQIGATSIQRGIVYQNTLEYRGGGRRGWNSAIYA